jgi:hypothetical protein
MDQLHNAINAYIHDLQTLQAQYSNRKDLLNAAEEKWGAESPEYLLLLTESPSQRWKNEPGNPPVESENATDENNVTVDWLPILQDLANSYPNDEDLLRKVKKDYKETSYLYQLIQKLVLKFSRS